MQRRFKFISILLALSIIISPIFLAVNNIASAAEANVDIEEEIKQPGESESTEGSETSDKDEEELETVEVEETEEKAELEIEEINEAEEAGINRIELQEAEDSLFKYVDNSDGTVKITGYMNDSPPADLVIPEEINGVPVKSIGEKAFYYSTSGGTISTQIKTLKLPEGLEVVGEWAFQGNLLEKINLPDSITELSERAFFNNKLTEIEFSNSLKSIGNSAFMQNKFTEIEIPSTVEEIQENAFTTNLLTNVILHDGLKTIGANAFEDNQIDEIIIPDTVENWPSISRDNSIFRRNGNQRTSKILYLVKVYNNSGATAENTFGIVNPASVTIEYKDSEGEEVVPSKTIVGKELKKAEKQGSTWVAVEGSGDDLLNYDVDKTVTYNLIKVIDEISENYYQMNQEYTFEPIEIEEYTTPESQTVTLDEKDNTITFTYTKEGEEPVDPAKPASIELSFSGGKQVTPLFPGGKQIINTKVLNGNGEEVKGEKVTFESSNPDVLKFSFLDTFTAGEVIEETIVTITATSTTNPEIKATIDVTVTPKTTENIIIANINEVKPYLDGQTGYNYNYLLSMSMIHNGEDADIVKDKMYIRDNYTSAKELAENIMTLIAAGEDPRDYDDNDYVEELINSQQTNGNFKLGYSTPDDKDLMMSVIALDMYEASIDSTEDLYNKTSAINLLLSKAKKDGSKYYYELKNSTEGDNIERSSLGLIALSKHQDNPQVMEIIGGVKKYFKLRQYIDGNIEGFKYNEEPQFRASSTASVIQALMAIGDNPLSEEWTEDGKTILDGLLLFKTSTGFKATDSTSAVTDTKATIDAFAALADLKNGKSMYGEANKGEEQEPDLTKPHSIKIKYEGGRIISELEEGSEMGLTAEVLNEDKEVLTDEKVNWEVSNEGILEFKAPNKFIAKKVETTTEVTITAVSQTDSNVKASIKLNVKPKAPVEPVTPVDLDEEIDFLKQCYEAYMTEDSSGSTGNAGLSMMATGSARLAGMDLDNIQKHIYIDEDNKSAYQLSQSIITLIGADLDPRQYNDKGKGKVRNLVEELEESQQTDGENKGEFVKAESDKNSIEAQTRSVIALDMAGGNYNEEIVTKLMEIYDKKDGSHTYKDIKTEGLVLTALSNHKDVTGVQGKIDEILAYLKTKQNKDGGFDIAFGFEKGTNSPTATGRVIQGLIANGINPLEDKEWIKNDSTMLHAIVKSKTVKDNMKNSGYGKGVEDEYTYYEATYTAFGALTDLKNQKSMFELLRLNMDPDAVPATIEIVKPDKAEIEVGQSLALTAKVYDKDGKVLAGQELIWSSSNEDVATVINGNVTTKGTGTATITAKVEGTEVQDTFTITVVEEIKTLEVNTAIIVFDEDGEYEVKSDPKEVTINKDEHDGGLTVFGALQATTEEYEGTGSWITSIYGITGLPSGGWMFTVNGKSPDTTADKVRLNAGDKVIWYCTYDYYRDYDKAPTWAELTGEEPEEKLGIKIVSGKSVKVGEELPLAAEVRKGDTIVTDKEIMWLSSNAEIATIEDGKLIAHKTGEVTVTAALAEDKDIKDTVEIKVTEADEEEITLEQVIKAVRKYYSKEDEFAFRVALGYNFTSNNLEEDLLEITQKFKTNEEPKTASEHVGNILRLIAAGKDPYNYSKKDYVKTLVNSQNAEGKFIIGQSDDYATTVAFSMLALDMAVADYDRDKAVDALLSYQDNSTGSFGGADETGMVLTALAKYKDKTKVQTAIEKGLDYLKGVQDANTGGFIAWGSENPYSTSAVLQGLMAVGEDPLSEKWTVGGKTAVDSLMNYYKDGYFENESEWGSDIGMVTEQAFIALADVYIGKSMFNEMKFNANEVADIKINEPDIAKIIEGEIIKLLATGYDENGQIVPVREIEWSSSDTDIAEVDANGTVTTKKAGVVTITAKVKDKETEDSIELKISAQEFEIEYTGDSEAKNGKQADAKVKLRNLTEEKKPAAFIVALYENKTNKLINYSMVKKELNSKEELELAAGFLVPELGNYYIKAFLWDDIRYQNILMQEAKEIEVAN